jgi:uncharacterized protein YgbK (DUF1537 family)
MSARENRKRILVFADDFTGAAEIGGVGLRYGLNTEVQAGTGVPSAADLIVIDTDTRSGTAREASRRIWQAACMAAGDPRRWVYKKTDSVLRGHVAVEIEALLFALGKIQALLVPANPSKGRIVWDRRYFIRGIELFDTEFSLDPEHPARSSDVLELLGRSLTVDTQIIKPGQELSGEGIFVGESTNEADLRVWAGKAGDGIIPAGGAEFFDALLKEKGFKRTVKVCPEWNLIAGKKVLFVFGSATARSRLCSEDAMKRGIPVFEIPSEFGCGPDCVSGHDIATALVDRALRSVLEKWLTTVIRAIKRHDRVIIGSPALPASDPDMVRKIRSTTSFLVSEILKQTRIDELLIEGGSTASRIAGRVGWDRFKPIAELAPGVVRMEVQGRLAPFLTVKPGSYPWPGKMWD